MTVFGGRKNDLLRSVLAFSTLTGKQLIFRSLAGAAAHGESHDRDIIVLETVLRLRTWPDGSKSVLQVEVARAVHRRLRDGTRATGAPASRQWAVQSRGRCPAFPCEEHC